MRVRPPGGRAGARGGDARERRPPGAPGRASPAPGSRGRSRSGTTRPGCASACASSPASRSSARCSASRPAARACGSSCATAPARCRARCGASDWDALGLADLADGAQVVAAGGCDYYAGSRTSSPQFSFAVTGLRLAGEGDLLAQVERLRRALHAEGLTEPQKRLPRPALPRTIGVVTGEGGKARDDVLAGAAPPRLGRAGRVGVRAGAGPPRRAGDHARAAGPRGLRAGRGDRRRARRRLARGPVRVLRRDAVPHRGDAARARHLLGRPPHRPHADRRRRRRRVLDADARRRGGRGGRLRRRADGAARPGRPAGAPERPRDRRPRAHARAALARAGPPRRPPPRPPAPAAARAAGLERPRGGGGRARQPPPRRRAGAQRAARPRPRRGSSTRSRSRSPRTTRSAPSSGATHWSRRPDGRPVTSAAAAAAQPELALRMHDGAVRVRPAGGVPSEPR